MERDKNPTDRLCMLSFDVEDWFHASRFKDVIPRRDWDGCELRVVQNMETLLAVLRKHRRRATFFVLGWVAERVPSLISRIQNDGHEIASHGYGHELLYRLTEEDFEADLVKSKRILQGVSGNDVIGYRAPDFSIVGYVPKVLSKHGFRYDSSLFPSSFSNRYGGIELRRLQDGLAVGMLEENLLEVPVTTLDLLGRGLPWGGGGYFRFYPYWLFRTGIRTFLKRKTGYLFYGHPWDLDPLQPRLGGLSMTDRVLHYGFLSKTQAKLERLLADFEFVPIREGLDKLGLL